MNSDFLEVPKDMEFFQGIGLFHVHGHQNEGFSRFAPNFISSAGQINGEIVETTWLPINNIANSTQNMLKAHCQETIDLHMNH